MLASTIALSHISQATISQLANTLLIVWMILSLPKIGHQHIIFKLILSLIITLIVNYIPVYNGLSISLYLRGIIAELSLTTLLILSLATLNVICGFKRQISAFNVVPAIIIIILAISLYLSTFGIIATDIYAWGYYPNLSFMIGFICLELAIYYFSPFYAFVWIIAAFAFYYKIQDSSNFWDYLFDPILVIMYILFIIQRLLKGICYGISKIK